VRELRAIEASETGEIAFGITQNYGFTLIPELLAGFGADHPGLRLHAVTAGFLDLASQVRTGRLEFAFGLLGPLDDASELVVETLRDHHSRVLARADHALTRVSPVRPADLAQARWATLDGAGFQLSFVAYFAAHGLAAPVQVLTTDSIGLIREVVAESDLLAVIPPDLVAARVEAGRLGILDCEAPAEQTRIGLMTRDGGLLSPHAARLAERIRAAVLPLHHHDTRRPERAPRTAAGP
jgi:LysR family transcriptional regulator of gallate degradation